jgi:glucose-1-phosphate cytidylyltransferase
MKVVLFCGGFGMRMREFSETIPKPMVNIGYRPILWHIMKYYAYYGHKEFILCLGHRADYVKDYFLNYNECISNDFVLSKGGKVLQLYNSDIDEWNVTFVDTGANSNIGERLKAVQKYLESEDVFLANYSDGLTNLPINEQIEHFEKDSKVASFLCVKPNLSSHFVTLDENGSVKAIKDISQSDIRINGGYFIFRNEIFQFMKDGEELLHTIFTLVVRRPGRFGTIRPKRNLRLPFPGRDPALAQVEQLPDSKACAQFTTKQRRTAPCALSRRALRRYRDRVRGHNSQVCRGRTQDRSSLGCVQLEREAKTRSVKEC